jgi:hypothetical protein
MTEPLTVETTGWAADELEGRPGFTVVGNIIFYAGIGDLSICEVEYEGGVCF